MHIFGTSDGTWSALTKGDGNANDDRMLYPSEFNGTIKREHVLGVVQGASSENTSMC